MERVLVLDACQRSALAVVRSLGKAGLYVVVADTQSTTLAGNSKYVAAEGTYADPSNETTFIDDINALIEQHNIDVVYPVTEITVYTLLENKHRVAGAHLPFPSIDTVKQLSNKASLVQLAEAMQLLAPKSDHFSDASKLSNEKAKRYQYPVVVKPNLSRVKLEQGWLETSVKYAFSSEELTHMVQEDPAFTSHAFMVQEYIEGEGSGVFLIYNKGKYVAHFAHRRLREKPPTGGVSVLSESITADVKQLEAAKSLLSEAGWHGVAMVEFKVSKQGDPYIIEVNPRFWGSLQLAIDSGVDFPLMLHEISMGRVPKVLASYRLGQKLRWVLGDLDHLYLVLKSKSYSASQKFAKIFKFLIPWQPNMRYEVNRLSDLKPFMYEIRAYFSTFKK